LNSVPEEIRFARFEMIDKDSVREKSELHAREDAAIFHSIALACCPEGCIYIWEEREEA